MTMTTALNTQIPVRSCATIPEPLRRLCDTHPGGHAMVISIVGAGGKTSCLFWLAQAFSQLGKKVMITTTTHMFLPREGVHGHSRLSRSACLMRSQTEAHLPVIPAGTR